MGNVGNPWGHGKHGYFRKSRKPQYASSDEWEDVDETDGSSNIDTQIRQIQQSQLQGQIRSLEERLSELDREIRGIEYSLEDSSSRMDTATLRDNELRLRKLRWERARKKSELEELKKKS